MIENGSVLFNQHWRAISGIQYERDDEKRERSSKVRRVKDNCGDVRRGGRRYFLLPGAKN